MGLALAVEHQVLLQGSGQAELGLSHAAERCRSLNALATAADEFKRMGLASRREPD